MSAAEQDTNRKMRRAGAFRSLHKKLSEAFGRGMEKELLLLWWVAGVQKPDADNYKEH